MTVEGAESPRADQHGDIDADKAEMIMADQEADENVFEDEEEEKKDKEKPVVEGQEEGDRKTPYPGEEDGEKVGWCKYRIWLDVRKCVKHCKIQWLANTCPIMY